MGVRVRVRIRVRRVGQEMCVKVRVRGAGQAMVGRVMHLLLGRSLGRWARTCQHAPYPPPCSLGRWARGLRLAVQLGLDARLVCSCHALTFGCHAADMAAHAADMGAQRLVWRLKGWYVADMWLICGRIVDAMHLKYGSEIWQ